MPWPLVFYLATWVAVEWGPVWVALAGGAGVALAGLWSWLLGRRTSSGRVETSNAAELWAESRAIRNELRGEVVMLREENSKLRERVALLEREVEQWRGTRG